MNTSKSIIKNERERIKSKLNIWVESIIKEKNVYKAIKKFEEIFNGKYIVDCKEDIEEDYYEEYIDTYYLKNKMKIVHSSGPQDKFGNMTSHEGDDLFIYSELSNNKEFAENGLCIFYENEYQESEIEKLRNIINENIGFKAIYGFMKDNNFKVTNVEDNGTYEEFGIKIIDFIKNTSIDKMQQIFDKIILVDSLKDAVNNQIEECKKCQNLDLDEIIEKKEIFRKFLKKTIGNLGVLRDDINAKYMVDKESELYSTDFAYIIDLDSKKIDIYWRDTVINSYDLFEIPKDWIDSCNKNLKQQIEKEVI